LVKWTKKSIFIQIPFILSRIFICSYINPVWHVAYQIIFQSWLYQELTW
jgi:hypothetical protein